MRRSMLVVMMLCLGLAVAAYADLSSKMQLKAGDEVYACNCGEACACNTLSRNPGKCTCGKDMVKAPVTGTGDGTATLKADGWDKERTFRTTGKYACACGPACTCGTISQNPGNCTCGTGMQKVN